MKTLAMMSLLLCGAVASAGIPSDVDWKNIKNDTRFVRLTSDEQTADYNAGTWSTDLQRWTVPSDFKRRYRLKYADTYYGELNHYGMYWLKWADVRKTA